MALGYHLILTTYGFWLLNDPRGSWSDYVGSWELFRAGGKATRITTRRSVACQEHDLQRRLATKEELQLPVVCFTGAQALAVGLGFKAAVESACYRVWACAILPEHVHLVVSVHERIPSGIIAHLKYAASQHLQRCGLHPFGDLRRDGQVPSCWGKRGWSVFLDSGSDVMRAIQYVEENPKKEGIPAQKWSFVVPFEP